MTTHEAVSRGMADVLEIERSSWKQGTSTSLPTEPGVEGFYSRLAEVSARRGWLRLSLLYLDRTAGGLRLRRAVFRNELLALKTSFDGRLADLSPGQGLLLQVIEDAFRDGLVAVDLLGYPARWKLEMANDERPHVDLCVFSRRILRCAACLLHGGQGAPHAEAVLATSRKGER